MRDIGPVASFPHRCAPTLSPVRAGLFLLCYRRREPTIEVWNRLGDRARTAVTTRPTSASTDREDDPMGGAKCLCPRAGIGLSNVTASATNGSRTRITAADARHLSEKSPLAETEDQPRCDGLARKTTNHSKLPHPHAALIG